MSKAKYCSECGFKLTDSPKFCPKCGNNIAAKKISDDKIINFLRYVINYLENRIDLVDKKASILIAVLGIVFASFTYIIKEMFWNGTSTDIITSTIFALSLVIFLITLSLLIQSIRPSKWFLGLHVPFDDMNIENYVMWPYHHSDDYFPSTSLDYWQRINKIKSNPLEIEKNYGKLHFITLQLIRRKYKFYRWATLSMKIWIAYSILGMTILLLLT